MAKFSGWFDRLLGRELPDQPTLRELKRQQQQVLIEQKDKIRVEVIEEVRGQMNRVFGVVDELKGQVRTLTAENLELKKSVATVTDTLTETNNKLSKLTETVTRNAATAANGMRTISRQIVGIGGPHTNLSVPEVAEPETVGKVSP